MADIATLGIRVDSRGVRSAAGDLRTFSRSAGQAARSVKALVVATASIATTSAFVRLADDATKLENALKVAGLEGKNLTRVYDSLFQSAQRNLAPVGALVELYSRASLVQKELNVSSAELLQFSDKIALALRVSGRSAQESSGALLQLSQALGSGVVRAEEFNSILEGALPIAQAAAAGLKEAGGSVARLRQLVIDGKVSSEAFFRAFEAGSVILEDKVAGAELTVSQSFIRLQNVLVDSAGKLDDTTGATSSLAQGIVTLSDNVIIATQNLIGFLDAFKEVEKRQTKSLEEGQAEIGMERLRIENEILALQNKQITASGAQAVIQKQQVESRIAFLRTQLEALGIEDASITRELAARANAAPASDGGVSGAPPVNTVSLANYVAPDDAARKASARATKKQAAAIADLLNNLRQENQLLQIQDPLQRKIAENLMNATGATQAQKDAIIELTAANDNLVNTQNALAERSEFAAGLFSGIAQDLRNGASAAKAFENALNKLLDKLLETSSQNLAQGFFGGSNQGGGLLGGGFLGNIFGGLLGGGSFAPGATGMAGLPMYEQGTPYVPKTGMAMLHKGEAVIPAKFNKGGMNGGGANIVVNNNAPRTEASARTAPDGTIEIIVEAVKQDMARGGFDRIQGARFGAKPVARMGGR